MLCWQNESGMQREFEKLIEKRPGTAKMTYNFLKNEVLELYNSKEIGFDNRWEGYITQFENHLN